MEINLPRTILGVSQGTFSQTFGRPVTIGEKYNALMPDLITRRHSIGLVSVHEDSFLEGFCLPQANRIALILPSHFQDQVTVSRVEATNSEMQKLLSNGVVCSISHSAERRSGFNGMA